MTKRLGLAVVLLAIGSSPLSATEERPFLSSQKAAAILADGLPWSAETPDGKDLKFTLNRDGTGSIRGPLPFALSVTWVAKGDVMCISGKMGTKCLRFRQVPGGLQGWDNEKPDLKFNR